MGVSRRHEQAGKQARNERSVRCGVVGWLRLDPPPQIGHRSWRQPIWRRVRGWENLPNPRPTLSHGCSSRAHGWMDGDAPVTARYQGTLPTRYRPTGCWTLITLLVDLTVITTAAASSSRPFVAACCRNSVDCIGPINVPVVERFISRHPRTQQQHLSLPSKPNSAAQIDARLEKRESECIRSKALLLHSLNSAVPVKLCPQGSGVIA